MKTGFSITIWKLKRHWMFSLTVRWFKLKCLSRQPLVHCRSGLFGFLTSYSVTLIIMKQWIWLPQGLMSLSQGRVPLSGVDPKLQMRYKNRNSYFQTSSGWSCLRLRSSVAKKIWLHWTRPTARSFTVLTFFITIPLIHRWKKLSKPIQDFQFHKFTFICRFVWYISSWLGLTEKVLS